MFSFSACNEETDENPPRIFTISPFENETFQATDTIEAIATVTDDRQIEYVDLEILDLDFNQVSVKERYTVSGSNVEFARLFPIGNSDLPTGDYYLAFRASDGENVGSGFVKIRINGVPRELEGVYVLTVQGNITRVHYREADEFEFDEEFSIASDAIGAALNYRKNILAIAGGDIGDAVFLETEEYSIVNSLPGFGTPDLPFFTSLSFNREDDVFYLSQRDGTMRIFDELGSSLVGFNGLDNHLILSMFGSGFDVYACEKQLAGPIHSLTRYTETGLLINVYPVAGEVLGVFEKSTNEEFVWIDNPEGLELRILNENSELLSLPYERPNTRLHGVIRISGNAFVINSEDGLLRYNYSNGGTVILDADAPEGELYFDDLNELIYLVQENQFSIYSIDGSQVGSASFNAPILYIGFDYNR